MAKYIIVIMMDHFTKQADGDVQRDVDVEAIFNSIENIVLTTQGERRMLPTFASNLKRLLFEPIDETTARLIARKFSGFY
jgi:phage baseplate assembly protein W